MDYRSDYPLLYFAQVMVCSFIFRIVCMYQTDDR